MWEEGRRKTSMRNNGIGKGGELTPIACTPCGPVARRGETAMPQARVSWNSPAPESGARIWKGSPRTRNSRNAIRLRAEKGTGHL